MQLNDPKRGGLLGHASVLTATSNGIETSPVVRGVWILENILGTPPAPPPPDVEPLEPDIRGSKTIREQLANHRKIATCNECHRNIDPLGFALENYDPIGMWRYNYGRNKPKVDASDVMADGSEFNGIVSFKKILLEKQDQFAQCLAEKDADLRDRAHARSHRPPRSRAHCERTERSRLRPQRLGDAGGNERAVSDEIVAGFAQARIQ